MGNSYRAVLPLMVAAVVTVLLLGIAGCRSNFRETISPTADIPTETVVSVGSSPTVDILAETVVSVGSSPTADIPAETVVPNNSSPDGGGYAGEVDVVLGRAVLQPNGRVTVFYVARNSDEEFEGPILIDGAEMETSGGGSRLAEGYGTLLNWAPLTLGWLTFLVADAAPGSFKVSVNSVQVDGGHLTGSWQLAQLSGFEARRDVSEPIVIDSGLCVSAGSVAIGFHEHACATEFVDPHSLREKEDNSVSTPVTPRPTPTPRQISTRPPATSTPPDTTLHGGDISLTFDLCTPWYFLVQVGIDRSSTPIVGSTGPSTSIRCVLPEDEAISWTTLELLEQPRL